MDFESDMERTTFEQEAARIKRAVLLTRWKNDLKIEVHSLSAQTWLEMYAGQCALARHRGDLEPVFVPNKNMAQVRVGGNMFYEEEHVFPTEFMVAQVALALQAGEGDCDG